MPLRTDDSAQRGTMAGCNRRWQPQVANCWNSNQDNARSADRNTNNPNKRNSNIGFRVVFVTSFCSFLGGTPLLDSATVSGSPSEPGTVPDWSADYGSRAEARKERCRGRVPSLRLAPTPPSGHPRTGAPHSPLPASRLFRAVPLRSPTSWPSRPSASRPSGPLILAEAVRSRNGLAPPAAGQRGRR